LGRLLSGLLAFHFAPEVEGHRTDAIIESFHREKGIVPYIDQFRLLRNLVS